MDRPGTPRTPRRHDRRRRRPAGAAASCEPRLRGGPLPAPRRGVRTTGACTPGATSTPRSRPRGRAGQPFTGEDSYGAFAWVKLKPGATNVGFLVVEQRHEGCRQRPLDRRDPDRRGLDQAGRPDALPDGRPPPASRTRRSTRTPRSSTTAGPTATTTGWGLHLWDGAANPTDVGRAVAARSSRRLRRGVPRAAGRGRDRAGYIIHNGDTKDQPDDQWLTFSAAGREVWVLAGQEADVCRRQLRRHAPDADLSQAEGAVDRPGPPSPGQSRTDATATGNLVTRPTGGISVVDGELYRHVHTLPLRRGARRADRGAARGVPAPRGVLRPSRWTAATSAKVPAALRGQVMVTERNASGRAARPRPGCRSPACSTTCYPGRHQGGARPDVRPAGRRTWRVWAPTARDGVAAALRLADEPSRRRCRHEPRTTPPASGRCAASRATGQGKYYRYRVEAWQPAAQSIVVTASVTDPYSVALAAGLHAQPDRRPGRHGARAGRLEPS